MTTTGFLVWINAHSGYPYRVRVSEDKLRFQVANSTGEYMGSWWPIRDHVFVAETDEHIKERKQYTP